jgi:hypothetical protein
MHMSYLYKFFNRIRELNEPIDNFVKTVKNEINFTIKHKKIIYYDSPEGEN